MGTDRRYGYLPVSISPACPHCTKEEIMKIPKEFKTRYNLDFNDQFIKAYDTAENTSKNVFITGKAGTGKSTLLKCFREIH